MEIVLWRKKARKQKPYMTYYDNNSNIWYVVGTLPPNQIGGTVQILISKEGEVLAVWYDK